MWSPTDVKQLYKLGLVTSALVDHPDPCSQVAEEMVMDIDVFHLWVSYRVFHKHYAALIIGMDDNSSGLGKSWISE